MSLETDMRDQLAELRRQGDAIAGRINAALIAGADTAPIRAFDAALRRDIAALENRIADADAQREVAAQSTISAAAGVIAADAENSIMATMARLAVPEHP